MRLMKWQQMVIQGNTTIHVFIILLSSYRIVGVDLQEMAPIPGCALIVGDITSEETVKNIFSHFNGDYAGILH